jgi:hypothetical protein
MLLDAFVVLLRNVKYTFTTLNALNNEKSYSKK